MLKSKKLKNYLAVLLCFTFICSMAANVFAALQDNDKASLPKDNFGINYTVFDTVATENAEGKYDATLTARLIANSKTVKEITGGTIEWSWQKRLPAPRLLNTPPLGTSPIGAPNYELPEDEALGLLSLRQIFKWFQQGNHGALTPGENGTGYKEFQLAFSNIEAVPGEVFNGVRVRDHISEDLGESTLSVTDMKTGEEVASVRENVTIGKIRIPGRTIVYKSNAEGSQVYTQSYQTDEELKGKELLDLASMGFPAEQGREFLGWSTTPNAESSEYQPGASLEEKNTDGSYKVQNVTLYPVYSKNVVEDDFGIQYVVYDTTATENAEGKYDATLTARLIANSKSVKEITGGTIEWSWQKRLPAPRLLNTPPLGTSPIGAPNYELPEDEALGLLSLRQIFKWFQEENHGALIPGENGTGYKEFRLAFSDIEAVPGEVFNGVRVRDHISEDLGESTLSVTDMKTGEEVASVRENVTIGKIRIPGRTIVYKSNAEGSRVYTQSYQTDEELKGKELLDLASVGFPAELDREFLGWSTTPNAESSEYQPGASLEEKNTDGLYKIQNITLYPVWKGEAHKEGNWVDYIVFDTKADKDPTLADGRYNATLNVRVIADPKILSEITGGTIEWSWPGRLPAPKLLNTPPLSSKPVGLPFYELEEDSDMGLYSLRQVFKWFQGSDHGVLTPGEDGYGYKEFQLYFNNFAAEPGEIIENIRVRDYFSLDLGESTIAGTSIDTGEEVPTERCHVIMGNITIPGKKMLYKSDDSEGAAQYQQIYYTDEEAENAKILNNDPTQNPNQPLTMPNFAAPEGKEFGGWSTVFGSDTAEYQAGDAIRDLENLVLYPVWIAKSGYTVSYDGNGGTPERASDTVLKGDAIASFPTAEHPDHYIFKGWFTEAEGGSEVKAPYTPVTDVTLYAHWETTYKVLYSAGNGSGEITDSQSPYQKDAYVVVLDKGNLTPPGQEWVFSGWESSIPVLVGTEEKQQLKPNDTFRMPGQDVTLTAKWSNTISDVCPLILDVVAGTLKNAKNENITNGLAVTSKAIIMTGDAFVSCNANHTHELEIVGNTDKSVTIEGSEDTKFNITVKGVNAKQLNLDNFGMVTFGSNAGDMDNLFTDINGEGLVIGENITGIKINEGSTVSAVADKGKEPILGTTGKAKKLVLTLYSKAAEDLDLSINGTSFTIPANYQMISVLDNMDGIWLKDDVTVTDPVTGKTFVRGLAEGDQDSKYLDPSYSANNIYGNTFGLTGNNTADTNGIYGRYQAVRIPEAVNQLKITVPTRIIFNIYTSGLNGAEKGFIAPTAVLNNESASFEDSILIDGEQKDYGRKQHVANVNYQGIQTRATSSYSLVDFAAVTAEQMAKPSTHPLVALEALANVSGEKRISLDDGAGTVDKVWFGAPYGESTIQLTVPSAYTDPQTKRYYQEPSDITDNTIVLNGFHTMKFSFSFGNGQ